MADKSAHKPPPVIWPDKSFKLGKQPPLLKHDEGSGAWGSDLGSVYDPRLRDLPFGAKLKMVGENPVSFGLSSANWLIVNEAYGAAHLGAGIGGLSGLPDAASNLDHYLKNVGTPVTIDLARMVAEVSSAKQLYQKGALKLKIFVEGLPPGSYDIVSTKVVNGYNWPKESQNWYLAVGGYSVWFQAHATITRHKNVMSRNDRNGHGPQHQNTYIDHVVAFEYKFYDRYNWDKGKSAMVMGFAVTDLMMGEIQRVGMAKEFDVRGAFKKSLKWRSYPTAQRKWRAARNCVAPGAA